MVSGRSGYIFLQEIPGIQEKTIHFRIGGNLKNRWLVIIMIDNIKELFKEYEDLNYVGKLFPQCENKYCNRSDLNAFILLDKLCPDMENIVSSTDHDEIYLSIDLDKLSKVVTDIEIKSLVSFGVFYNDEYECLSMFV